MSGAVVGFDTATPATAAALLRADGRVFEARDDPAPGERPQHASRLLELVEAVLAQAGTGWGDVGRIAVGVGPGGFTGLRIGVATARALAQARGLPVVGVSSLEALAAGASGPVAAVIDARRGEVFAAAWRDGRRVIDPAAYAPPALAERLAPLAPLLAVGDGAVRFSEELTAAGAAIPPEGSPEHRISAAHICRLGARGEPADRDALLPDYRREPDAKPSSPR
ncbi:MAG TPA: tRNA (adenosine(37)-N6)-threonylcarbamoyltransferase complex dimerization subunit type 1 TsaB [Solirubrobacteraceae bacterium]